MRIVPEEPRHRPAVLEINRLAFKGEEEARLIEELDRDGDVIASLVAVDGTHVLGHILFSRLDVIVEGRSVLAAALAPMAVTPNRQKQGIGSQLVRHGIEVMKSMGQAAIIVVGHEAYYPRFGFGHDVVKHLACLFSQYEAFMGLELAAGSLTGRGGTCRYPRAFGLEQKGKT